MRIKTTKDGAIMNFETVVEKIGGGVQLRACERLGVHPSTLLL
jgi:hypothetical protein